jgi:sugar (pentulose or hexulose) kinase
MYWMGNDVGTGGTRALLIDEQGQVKAGYTSPATVQSDGCHVRIRSKR